MKTKLKKLSDTRVEIAVKLEAEDFKDAATKALEKLAKEVKVEGFRKGKVPVEVAKKFIPENDLNAEILDYAVRSTVGVALQDEKIMPLVPPSVNVTKFVPGEEAEYTITADIIPEIKLADYKKLDVKKEAVEVTDKDVKEMLDNIATARAEKKAVRKSAELGDEVVIDFVGKKDGEAFDGGSAKDFKLLLGSGTFIPGFEDGVVGHEPGDKFELELTFPKDYGVKDLAGAKTVFEILVKQINELQKPAIDDEFAQSVGPFKTLKELEDDIRKNIELQNERRINDKFKNDLVEALVKVSKIPAPEVLVDDQVRAIREDATRNASSQGVSFEEFVERSGDTLEHWEKEVRKVAEQRVKGSLALQTIVNEEKITVPDSKVEERLAELREIYKKSSEAVKGLKDPKVKANIKNQMIVEAALDFLAEANSK